jgi:transcription termination factor Rho
VCEPYLPLRFVKTGYNDKVPVAAKAIVWILPLLKGQRACIRSLPKAGKTHLIYDLAMGAHGQKDLRSFVLLLDQTPETVSRFRKLLPYTELIYTTYETDCDKQVYAAEFLLKRAKRYVESGYDVLLIVDSLNALARAYNETNESVGGKVLAGGLESKTVHYLKKYFGTSRCLEDGGSLTMLCALAEDTGNPADDIIASEVLSLSNYEIALNEKLAQRRVYPSIDYKKSRSDFEINQDKQKENKKFIVEKFHGAGEEILNAILANAETIDAFNENLKKDRSWK